MAPIRIAHSHFSPDIGQFIRLLHRHGVRYLIVGGEAVIFHGHSRLTGDVDFFFDGGTENARRLFVALHIAGLKTLIRNKEALGRPKDLDDLQYLRRAAEKDGVL